MRNTITLAGALLIASHMNAQQIGIGTTTPHPSAALEINSANQGILIPRVALQGPKDSLTIPSPAVSLLVYNTGTPGLEAGYYYWNGNTWNKLVTYAGGSGSMPSDSDWVISGQHMYSSLSGNVGIGTTNPVFKLDVNGQGRFVGKLTIGNYTLPNVDGPAGTVLTTDGNGVVTWQEAQINAQAPLVGVGTSTNPLRIQNGTSNGDVLMWNGSNWIITKPGPASGLTPLCGSPAVNYVQKWTGNSVCNSQIYDNGTNIGIGTATPAQKLHVAGNVRVDGNLYVYGPTQLSPAIGPGGWNSFDWQQTSMCPNNMVAVGLVLRFDRIGNGDKDYHKFRLVCR
ncbi:MAG: hypothetical protein GXO48_07465 [Chlorobi bacterium]|nr:hypothetical protein [Chlorobiota bacterium]